ncbi:hypothetical protein K491DRAFT_719357 [Lophiostoma macrostomum CBS 122681]|uniref:Uncharacterized protein n=1 Tax=Lophiostoma macrostomum CBS 122681 TaxID=1314788 RepID=A0A6A6T083_9PLEO|nr:hypothetical protein K491DRAFT_719357 [Lophiostoma macrostomum CBS 122681]
MICFLIRPSVMVSTTDQLRSAPELASIPNVIDRKMTSKLGTAEHVAILGTPCSSTRSNSPVQASSQIGRSLQAPSHAGCTRVAAWCESGACESEVMAFRRNRLSSTMGYKEAQQDDLLWYILCIDGYAAGRFQVHLFTPKPTVTVANTKRIIKRTEYEPPKS